MSKKKKYAATDYTEYFEKCKSRLHDPQALEWLKTRGLSLETVEKYGIGFDPEADPFKSGKKIPRLIIPTGTYQWVGYDTRPPLILPLSGELDEELAKKLTNRARWARIEAPGARTLLFDPEALYASPNPVFVVNSPLDALSIVEAGYRAVALNQINAPEELLKQLKSRAPRAKGLILCPYPKDKSREVFKGLAKELKAMGIPTITVDICAPAKGPNAHLMEDPEGFQKTVRQVHIYMRKKLKEAKAAASGT